MRNIALAIIVALSVLGTNTMAKAAEVTATGTIKVIANNDLSDASIIQIPTNIASACNVSTVSRAYIRRENKEIYAAALTAAAQNLSVTVGVETASTSMTVHGYNPTPNTCEVFSIVIN